MKRPGRKCFGAFLGVGLAYIAVTGVIVHVTKGKENPLVSESDEQQWIATSKSWLDRQVCRWVGLCGLMHLNRNGWTWDDTQDDSAFTTSQSTNYWTSGSEDPDSWSREELAQREIPQYVLDYAPYVHLFSGEQFWPCDMASHLRHTTARLNYTEVLDLEHEVNLTTLHELNDYEGGSHGKFMYLQSNDNVEDRPKWLGGAKNIPFSPRRTRNKGKHEDVSWPRPDGESQTVVDLPDERIIAEGIEAQGAMSGEPAYVPLPPSLDGRCGGSSGFSCKGSGFGKCCSIYGWCGKGDDYCGEACDPLSGLCNNPWEPFPRPHKELRRRRLNLQESKPKSKPIGKSSAPAILIVVNKGNDVVDAFWFFFYSYNLGQKVFNIRFGNHVGDWEHTMIRFKGGKPHTVFLSEHDFGDAYEWRALEKYLPNSDGSGMVGTWSNGTAAKIAKRPVVYSAVGSHAMYARPGVHPYILPWGLLHDQTDRGPLWDPALNFQSFTYDPKTKVAKSSNLTPKAPVGWFHYQGHWGDKYYPLSDPRQYRLAGQYHYVNGPTGPLFKNLGRSRVCQDPDRCNVKSWVGDAGRGVRFPTSQDELEEGGLPGGNRTDDDPPPIPSSLPL